MCEIELVVRVHLYDMIQQALFFIHIATTYTPLLPFSCIVYIDGAATTIALPRGGGGGTTGTAAHAVCVGVCVCDDGWIKYKGGSEAEDEVRRGKITHTFCTPTRRHLFPLGYL